VRNSEVAGHVQKADTKNKIVRKENGAEKEKRTERIMNDERLT
jgi:hypothetical protein